MDWNEALRWTVTKVFVRPLAVVIVIAASLGLERLREWWRRRR
jgi:hypothetical protein